MEARILQIAPMMAHVEAALAGRFAVERFWEATDRDGAALLAERGGGAIVNTASIAGLQGLVSPLMNMPGFIRPFGLAKASSTRACRLLSRNTGAIRSIRPRKTQ